MLILIAEFLQECNAMEDVLIMKLKEKLMNLIKINFMFYAREPLIRAENLNLRKNRESFIIWDFNVFYVK